MRKLLVKVEAFQEKGHVIIQSALPQKARAELLRTVRSLFGHMATVAHLGAGRIELSHLRMNHPSDIELIVNVLSERAVPRLFEAHGLKARWSVPEDSEADFLFAAWKDEEK